MTITDPKSTAAHLSSDLHDLCVLQKLSRTTSVVGICLLAARKRGRANSGWTQVLHVPRTSLLQRKKSQASERAQNQDSVTF